MKLSLKAKAIFLVISVSALIGISAIVVYDRGISSLVTNDYESRSAEITRAMAEILDADKVKTLRDNVLEIYREVKDVVLSDQWGSPEFYSYVSKYSEIENTPEFDYLRKQLRQVQDAIDVDCLYIVWIDVPNWRYVYLVDGAYDDACPPGCVDPLFVDDLSELGDLNKEMAPNVTHTPEYGHLVTTGSAIHTSKGELVGYAVVDLSMNDIVVHERNLLLMSILIFAAVTFIAGVGGIIAVDRTIVTPINKLSQAAGSYTDNGMRLSKIGIHTGDEIETLAESMKRMEKDIKEYYDNLMETKSDLETAKEHAEIYKREANIDPLTGLLNKRAYDLAVADLEKTDKPYAVVMIDMNDLKSINDQFGHDKGDISIKTLASKIRRCFKDSAVFRIGGDEFAVIMNGDDLDIRDSLIGRFRDEIRKGSKNKNRQAWEIPTAACGYATFNPKSQDSFESVFRRADEDMYQHKIKMKNTHH